MGDATKRTSLEDELGPAAGRYFGFGYRQVMHEILPAMPEAATESPASAWTGCVIYPEAWSLNVDGTSREPHLSSVDAILLPLLALQHAHAGGAGDDSLRRRWVRTARLRAGGASWDDLDHVPINFNSAPSLLGEQGDEDVVARVGNIRVGLTLTGDEGSDAASDNCQILGQLGSIYAGDYRRCWVESFVTNFDPHVLSLSSTHVFTSRDDGHGRLSPAAAPAETTASIVDYLVTMGQLTQALVYRAHKSTRSEVGNIWMRSLDIAIPARPLALPSQFQAVTRVVKDSVVCLGSRRMRTLQVTSKASHGVVAVANLAYAAADND